MENGSKHPEFNSTALPEQESKVGRGLQSVEEVYKATKVKAALKLYSNEDPTMNAVRQFEEHSTITGHQSLLKDAIKYADELGIAFKPTYPNPTGLNKDDALTKSLVNRSVPASKDEINDI